MTVLILLRVFLMIVFLLPPTILGKRFSHCFCRADRNVSDGVSSSVCVVLSIQFCGPADSKSVLGWFGSASFLQTSPGMSFLT